MSRDQLIIEQQLEIQEYKRQLKQNKDFRRVILMRFLQEDHANVLQMNMEQQRWLEEIRGLVESISYEPRG